jgi:hypothetical protein
MRNVAGARPAEQQCRERLRLQAAGRFACGDGIARGEPPQRGTCRDARLTAAQSTIFYAVDRRLGSWSTVSADVPGGT